MIQMRKLILVQTILLSKSTDSNTVLPIVPGTSFWQLIFVAQDSIQDQCGIQSSLVFSNLEHFPSLSLVTLIFLKMTGNSFADRPSAWAISFLMTRFRLCVPARGASSSLEPVRDPAVPCVSFSLVIWFKW